MNARPSRRSTAAGRLLIVLALAPFLFVACLGAGAGNLGAIGTPAPGTESDAPSDGPPTASPSESAEPSGSASAVPSTEPSPSGSTSAPTAEPTAEPTESAEPSEPPVETMESVAYFLKADPLSELSTLIPVSRVVPKTLGVGRAALNELLAGPTEEEGCCGIETAVPEGAVLLGLTIEDGLATVDLSREFESGGGSFSMGARLAQVVYTITRFPTVDRVNFRLDGEPVTVFSGEGLILDHPVTRDDYRDYLPAIFIDSPAWGAEVDSPFEVRGMANVFEAQFLMTIYDDADDPIYENENVRATCGTGCWGTFSQEIRLPAEVSRRDITVRVWNRSARDGSAEDIRDHILGVGRRPDLSARCGC
jgi:spore germination protein GerM